MVVANADVSGTVILEAERVCGCDEQIFHDETLEHSLFFDTMRNSRSCTNVRARWSWWPCPQSRLSVHTNVDVRHQRAMVDQIPCVQMHRTQRVRVCTNHSEFLPLPADIQSAVPPFHTKRATNHEWWSLSCDHNRQTSLLLARMRCKHPVTLSRLSDDFSIRRGEFLHAQDRPMIVLSQVAQKLCKLCCLL